MATAKVAKCAALGCGKPAAPTFCATCRKKLPRDLRADNKAVEAVVYLGKKDGYLAAVPDRPVVLTDNPGTADV